MIDNDQVSFIHTVSGTLHWQQVPGSECCRETSGELPATAEGLRGRGAAYRRCSAARGGGAATIAMRATEVTAILVLIPTSAAYNAIAKLING